MDPLTMAMLGGGAISGLYGLYQHKQNRPEMIDSSDYTYDAQTMDYNTNKGMLSSANQLSGMGTEFMGAYRQMLNPGSAYNQGLFGELRRSSSDMTGQLNTNMRSTLASQGIDQGGMASLLSSANAAQMSEGLRKGFVDIQDTSLSRAGQFGSLATSAEGQAGNLYSTIDDRTMRANMFNTGALNEANRFNLGIKYQTDMGNQNAMSAWRDAGSQQWMNLGSGLMGIGSSMYGANDYESWLANFDKYKNS